MPETFMSMADARRVAEGRKKIIDDLKKRIETLESENKWLKTIIKEHGIDLEIEDKHNVESSPPSKDKPFILGLRPPTTEEVDSGQAQWCWTCGNTKCQLSKHDKLMMCLFFDERSREDIESDPYFGDNEND